MFGFERVKRSTLEGFASDCALHAQALAHEENCLNHAVTSHFTAFAFVISHRLRSAVSFMLNGADRCF